MRCFSLSAALFSIGTICGAEAFLAARAGGAINGLSRASASGGYAGRCKLAPAATSRLTTMGLKSPVDVLKQGIARAGAGIYDKDAVVSVVKGYTAGSGNKKVVVFSWTRCPFCKKAKQLVEDLLANSADYEFVELDEREDGNAIRYELSQMTGRTSVPQIWIGGDYVGGCNDGPGIFTLMEKGELVPMLKAAGCKLK